MNYVILPLLMLRCSSESTKSYLSGFELRCKRKIKHPLDNACNQVESLELPAITICPKVPDALNSTALLNHIRISLPEIDNATIIDLVRFWIGGNGLENMDVLSRYNRTYLSYLNHLYQKWSNGHSTEDFFHLMQKKFGYSCNELFQECQLGGRLINCCDDLFRRQIVMRRGICFQTRKGLNQTEADDIGRLVLSIKTLPSITSPQYNFIQPQVVVYITDNFEHVIDFPRFYLYPNEWNRIRFTARYIELIESDDVCTKEIFGKDAECLVRRWLLSNIVYPFNCTLSYLSHIDNLPPTNGICKPNVIAENYYKNIQLIWNHVTVNEKVCSEDPLILKEFIL
ncbi:hypothetical protein DICVIV_12433 [Dictyocaulus viviparus]|uniref:Uncharacterized protein n=1 Tax=Dictyocaulus viviparus TaxID=29172 RepID=A0A0D8XD55_DICVI|nr:hypothetical protein DICVIV_12433 [Dictyocaulus viviparus]